MSVNPETDILPLIQASPKTAKDIARELDIAYRTAVNNINKLVDTGRVFKERDPNQKNGFIFRIPQPVAKKTGGAKAHRKTHGAALIWAAEEMTWAIWLRKYASYNIDAFDTRYGPLTKKLIEQLQTLYREAEHVREKRIADQKELDRVRNEMKRQRQAHVNHIKCLDSLLDNSNLWKIDTIASEIPHHDPS